MAAAVLWAAKAVAIGSAGGLGRSPAEAPLFFLGMICWAVAVVTGGLGLSRGRSAGVRVLAVLAAVAAAALFTLLISAAVVAVQPDRPSWIWGEVNLWVLAIVTLVVAFGAVGAHSRRSSAAERTISAPTGVA